MENLTEYLPFLIPILIIQLVLMVTCVVHILRHPHYKFGNKPLWLIVTICLSIVGPIAYLIFGRGEQ